MDQKLCWFSDTREWEYCIDFVSGTSESLVVLSGDSGHGFKMMPVFGKWFVELLERGKQKLPRWQWTATKMGKEDKNWGDEVSWRIGTGKELINEKDRTVKARL